MILRYMEIELSREPSNIVDWVRYARFGLRHLLSTHRTLCGDGNAVLVISHLHHWCRHILSVAPTEVSFGRLPALQTMLTRRYRPLRPPSGRIDARWGTITYVRVVDGVVDEFARFATPREGAGPVDTRIEASANHPGNSKHIRCPYLAVANHLRDILSAPN